MNPKHRQNTRRIVGGEIGPRRPVQPMAKKRRRITIAKFLRIARQYIPLIKQRWTKTPQRVKLTTLSCVATIIMASIYFSQFHTAPAAIEINTPASAVRTGKLEQGTPDYDTILPAGKTIQDFGGWTRVSPPNRNPVFAYVDKIDNIPINVSEQPLPDEFKEDAPQQIEQLAAGYKANQKIMIDGVAVHIGTSAKGPQSVIFNKDNLLVLIKSSAQLSNDQWVAYINSLK